MVTYSLNLQHSLSLLAKCLTAQEICVKHWNFAGNTSDPHPNLLIFFLLSKALEKLEEHYKTQVGQQDQISHSVPLKVTVNLVSELCGSMDVIEEINALPTQQKLVLCAVLKLIPTTSKITYGMVHKQYVAISKALNLPVASSNDFQDLFQCVCTTGLVTLEISTSKPLLQQLVRVDVSEKDLLLAFQEIHIFQSVLK